MCKHPAGESCRLQAQVQRFLAALGTYHKPDDIEVAAQARNDRPCAYNFGIGGAAVLCFVLLFLFCLEQAGRPSQGKGWWALSSGRSPGSPPQIRGEQLVISKPTALQNPSDCGGRGSSVRSLPSLAVTLGAASVDTALARREPCAVPSGPTLAR